MFHACSAGLADYRLWFAWNELTSTRAQHLRCLSMWGGCGHVCVHVNYVAIQFGVCMYVCMHKESEAEGLGSCTTFGKSVCVRDTREFFGKL